MLKSVFKKLLALDTRQSARYPVSKFTQCILRSPKVAEEVSVYLCDISLSGLSFFFKYPWFEEQDTVKVVLLKDFELVELTGPIVSQKILYPPGHEDLKLAIYRYSIRFTNPITSKSLECFKDEPRK